MNIWDKFLLASLIVFLACGGMLLYTSGKNIKIENCVSYLFNICTVIMLTLTIISGVKKIKDDE